jgi:hypothetical protein
LLKLADDLIDFPIGSDEIRNVDDGNYMAEVYVNGATAVLHGVLACQSLTDEMERNSEWSLGGLLDPKARMGKAARLAGLEPLPKDRPGWAEVSEMVRVRHAIEHPDASTYVNHQDPLRVPLAWMLSERPRKVFPAFEKFFSSLADSWVAALASRPRQTVTYQVERGIASKSPAKKSPRTPPK